MSKRRYVYYQPNKKGIKDQYGDCQVRALSKALNITWALRKEEYCGFGNDHVLTFAVYDRKLVLNLRPTF